MNEKEMDYLDLSLSFNLSSVPEESMMHTAAALESKYALLTEATKSEFAKDGYSHNFTETDLHITSAVNDEDTIVYLDEGVANMIKNIAETQAEISSSAADVESSLSAQLRNPKATADFLRAQYNAVNERYQYLESLTQDLFETLRTLQQTPGPRNL